MIDITAREQCVYSKQTIADLHLHTDLPSIESDIIKYSSTSLQSNTNTFHHIVAEEQYVNSG